MIATEWTCPSGHSTDIADSFCPDCGAAQPTVATPAHVTPISVLSVPPTSRAGMSGLKIAAIAIAALLVLFVFASVAIAMLGRSASNKFSSVGDQIGMPAQHLDAQGARYLT